MYKKPPEDDEPREYPEFTYPARRRRQDITPQQPPVRHRTGEHPEVPKVRRASLYYYKSQTRRPSRPALDGEKDEQDTDAKASRRMVTPDRRPSSPAAPSSSARRSQHTHTRTRTRPVRSRRPFSASLQQLSRNPAVMIIARKKQGKGTEPVSKKARRANRHASQWAFAELHSMLSYKAALAGSLAIKVDADYTSQSCPYCGYADRRNRPGKGLLFICQHERNVTSSAKAPQRDVEYV